MSTYTVVYSIIQCSPTSRLHAKVINVTDVLSYSSIAVQYIVYGVYRQTQIVDYFVVDV